MFRIIQIYFLMAMLYSFLGWMMEVVRCYFKYGKFINRGFLVGPYCPIYGFGAVFLELFYGNLSHNIFIVFMASIFDAAILEYLTSYIMEKMFGARWWDYSDRNFNINGRICLENLVGFGFLSIIILYLVNPFFFGLISSFSNLTLNILFYTLGFCIISDYILSYNVLRNVKKNTQELKSDNTEEMHRLVIETVKEKSWVYRRLLNAYPNLKFFKTISKEKLKEIIAKSDNEKIKRIRIKAEMQKEDVRKRYEIMIEKIDSIEKKKISKIEKRQKMLLGTDSK